MDVKQSQMCILENHWFPRHSCDLESFFKMSVRGYEHLICGSKPQGLVPNCNREQISRIIFVFYLTVSGLLEKYEPILLLFVYHSTRFHYNVSVPPHCGI